MTRGMTGFAVAVVLALALAGCAKPAAPLQLSAADSGSRQKLAVGQQLEIVLDSNPTTGYQWAIDGALPPQLEQVGQVVHKTESSAIGAGGTDTWTFAGKTPGTATLKLKYWRSFEPTAKPEGTFEVTVGVQ